jgi:hypothetical protein
MKTTNALIVAASVCGLFLAVQSSFAQGSLTPPGAPGPTMKTLAQIEPRTPISSLPFTISLPGSYYLTTNLTASTSNSIFINTNGVTLDLMGFTISSTVANAASGGSAILVGDVLNDITIRNGHIRGGVTASGSVYSGSGFAYGIYNNSGTQPQNVHIADITITGCLYDGINFNEYGDSPTFVESCLVQNVGGYGIVANTVSRSIAYAGLTGIEANICSDSYGFCTGGGSIGLSADEANNCQGYSQGSGAGLAAGQAINCAGYSYGPGAGLSASSVATGCYGASTTGPGLSAVTANNCYGISYTSGNGVNVTVGTGCYGSSISGWGLSALLATGCYGTSSNGFVGLYAESAINCIGVGVSAAGLDAPIIALGCYGTTTSGNIGLSANLANSCIGTKNGSYSVSDIYKYNMP